MDIFIEALGYIGTFLIIISMMMTSISKLRIINICGAVFSTVYAALSIAYPIVVLNLVIIGVNVYKLIHDNRELENNKD